MMADITLSDAMSLANGAKKAISEGYDVPMMTMSSARLADELDNIKASAEAAKEELRKAREQGPVLCKAAFSNGDGTYSYDYVTWPLRKHQKPVHPVEHFYYTTPKPAAYGVDDATAQHIALAVYDYQNRISDEPLMHAINRILIKGSHLLSAEYLAQMQGPKPAVPSVPEATCNDNLQVPREWREMLEFLISQRGKAGHSHRRPGIWDDDNGVLAGKPCDVCAMYDRARDLLQSSTAGLQLDTTP